LRANSFFFFLLRYFPFIELWPDLACCFWRIKQDFSPPSSFFPLLPPPYEFCSLPFSPFSLNFSPYPAPSLLPLVLFVTVSYSPNASPPIPGVFRFLRGFELPCFQVLFGLFGACLSQLFSPFVGFLAFFSAPSFPYFPRGTFRAFMGYTPFWPQLLGFYPDFFCPVPLSLVALVDPENGCPRCYALGHQARFFLQIRLTNCFRPSIVGVPVFARLSLSRVRNHFLRSAARGLSFCGAPYTPRFL